VNNRGAVQFDLPREHTPDNAANLIAGAPSLGWRTGDVQLFRFSSFVLVRLVDSGLYRREKRVAARRGVHIA
jgi:hypothetical protein